MFKFFCLVKNVQPQNRKKDILNLNGQCHEIFELNILLKNINLGPRYEQAKKVPFSQSYSIIKFEIRVST